MRFAERVTRAEVLLLAVVECEDHEARGHEAADELVEGYIEPGLKVQPFSHAVGDREDEHEVAAAGEVIQHYEHCHCYGLH